MALASLRNGWPTGTIAITRGGYELRDAVVLGLQTVVIHRTDGMAVEYSFAGHVQELCLVSPLRGQYCWEREP